MKPFGCIGSETDVNGLNTGVLNSKTFNANRQNSLAKIISLNIVHLSLSRILWLIKEWNWRMVYISNKRGNGQRDS